MATKATKDDIPRQPAPRLTVAQLNAVDCLVSGMTDAETAEAVGVGRQTVNAWKNHSAEFRAALNARRADVWGAAGDRLRSLVPKAVTVLETALDGPIPDPRIALDVLKLAGIGQTGAALGAVGPTTAVAILDAEILARKTSEDPTMASMLLGPVSSAADRAALELELAGLLAIAAGE